MVIFLTIMAFLAVAWVMPFARNVARRFHLVDKPGGRKKHEVVTPLVGGIVVFSVFTIASLVFLWITGALIAAELWFFAALSAIVTVGAMDDRKHIPAWTRFGIQFVVAFMIVLLAGAKLSHLGDLFGLGTFWLGFMAIPFSVIAAVLLINAINLIDGLDGLCAGNAFIVFGFMAAWCFIGGDMLHFALLLFIMAALAGFLLYNLRTPFRKKASVFLGDAGSLGLGLTIAWFAMNLGGGTGKHATIEPMAVAWMLAWPIFDICGQFARRMSEGRHPFDPDHDHFHHHYINLGMKPEKATAFILTLAFIGGFIGSGGLWLGVPLPVLTVLWIVLLLVHIALSMKPERYRKLIAKVLRHDG